MKALFATAVAVAVLAHPLCGAADTPANLDRHSQHELALSASHRATLDAYREAYAQGCLHADVDRFGRHWTESVRLMPEYHPTVFGSTDARRYYQALFARLDLHACERTPLNAIDLGPKVVEIGRFTLTVAVKGSGSTHQLAGKYLEIWDEAADGSLGLATIAWNFDRYSPIEQDLRFPALPGVRQAMQAHLPIRDRVTFELGALLKLHETAVLEGDTRVWSMLFADDAVMLGNHQPLVEGRAAIEAELIRHAKELPVFEKLDLRNDRADDLGRYVVEYASHVANWRNGDSSGVNTGKAIRVWRREPHGGLRVLWSIGMYD